MAIFTEAAGKEGHGGKQSQALFDHTAQIFELAQVLRVNRSVRRTLAFQRNTQHSPEESVFLRIAFIIDTYPILEKRSLETHPMGCLFNDSGIR